MDRRVTSPTRGPTPPRKQALNQQGFKSTLLFKSFHKFYRRHGVIIDKHQITTTAGEDSGNQ